MFSRKEQLIQRTGKDGVGRYDFLKLLVTEFNTTKSRDAKEQVLANLANFAYDPVNYDYLRNLRVIDVFLHALSEDNPKLVRFAIGGLCNICLDPLNKEYILRNEGVRLVISLLSTSDVETVLSTITTLIFLITPSSKADITSPTVIDHMVTFSKSSDKCISNLANIFLNDYCEARKIEQSGESSVC